MHMFVFQMGNGTLHNQQQVVCVGYSNSAISFMHSNNMCMHMLNIWI